MKITWMSPAHVFWRDAAWLRGPLLQNYQPVPPTQQQRWRLRESPHSVDSAAQPTHKTHSNKQPAQKCSTSASALQMQTRCSPRRSSAPRPKPVEEEEARNAVRIMLWPITAGRNNGRSRTLTGSTARSASEAARTARGASARPRLDDLGDARRLRAGLHDCAVEDEYHKTWSALSPEANQHAAPRAAGRKGGDGLPLMRPRMSVVRARAAGSRALDHARPRHAFFSPARSGRRRWRGRRRRRQRREEWRKGGGFFRVFDVRHGALFLGPRVF